MSNTPIQPIDALRRGTEAIHSEKELAEKLARAAARQRPLRVKLGMDPTAPDIHLGHSVVLRKLRQFQDLGHKAILIIGDFTALIGDPSGRSKTRPVLLPRDIEKNAETYFQQAGKILRTDPDHLEIRHNSSWLADMKFDDVLKLAGQVTLGQMLKREDFRNRFEKEIPLGVHELMYPLMQAYDSVMVEADIELGGTDQTFNNLLGRDLQINADQEPQVVMIMPILSGLNGVQKMSKSLGNYVGLADEPKLMFERIMSISDDLMRQYFTLLTDTPADELDRLLDPQHTHPKQAKVALAKHVVAAYHDQRLADWAADEFDRIHAKHELPENIPEVIISTDGPCRLAALLRETGLVDTGAEAKRLIRQGGARVNGRQITDPNAEITPEPGTVLQVGRRRFARLTTRQS